MKDKIINFIENKKLFLTGILIAIFFIVIDQITKILVFKRLAKLSRQTLGLHRHIQITPFFNLVKVWNKGVSFGMFNNLPFGKIILSLITLVIAIFVLYLLWKSKTKYSMIYLSLVIGGAIGNLIDRIRFGAVADFLDFHFAQYHWPAFNIADSIVCIGVFMILIEELVKKKFDLK